MKRKNKTSKKKPRQVRDHWDFYFSDNKVGSTAINLALKGIAPIKNKPNLARITLKMNNPQANGFSSQEESGILPQIENAIANQGKANNNSIHVARHTGGGNRTIYFYCDDTDSFNDLVCHVMAGFADYQYDIDFQEDKEWKVYSGLYPSKWQFQFMMNRNVIHELIKNGDNLSQARPVEHTLLFKNKTDRKSFLKEAKKQGFTVCDQFYEKSLEAYGLEISRVDKVDWKSVDEYVFKLMNLAEQHHGLYGGWATWTDENASPPAIGLENDFLDSKG